MKRDGFRSQLKNLKKALVGEAPSGAATAPDGAEKSAPASSQKKRAVKGLLLLKNPEPEPLGTLCTLISWRSPVHNTRLLIAYLPGTDPHDPLQLVSVRVASNRNFLAGMELTARKVDERTYDLEGKCPARRGRWR